MKRRSLARLITNDLADLAFLLTDVIASEESIRFMMTMFKDKKALINIEHVHKDQFLKYLEKRVTDEGLFSKEGHHQFLVEVGYRSKAKQRDPATIHYCGLDLFIRPGLPPIAFVADHYRLHGGYYGEFQAISQKLGVQFVVVGGGVYQADSVHCPIFTFMHLLLTAKDKELLSFLESKVGDNKSLDVVNITWDDLPPSYVQYPQSMTTIWDYVDKVKKKESLPPHIPSKLLSESAFAEKVSPGFSPIQSKDPGLNNKMRSKGVKYLAADYAGMAVLELEKNPEVYTDQMLIDICYKERYPLIHQMLTKALYIEQTYPWKEKIDKSHPLFELAFAHGPVLEFCLSKPGFGKIFNDEAILLLMQKGFLDPAIFFTKLTRVSSSIELDLQIVNFVVGNLPACSFLAKALINEDKVDKQLLLTVLFSTKTKAFFQDTLLTDLFMTGHISLSMIDKILPYKIDKQLFKQLNHNTRMEYLKMLFFASETMKEEKFLEVKTTTPSTLITASKLEDVEEENAEHTDFDQDLFTVPEVKTVKPTESAKKPGINVGLLIQSMTNGGILQSPTLSHVEHPEKSKSVEIKVNVL